MEKAPHSGASRASGDGQNRLREKHAPQTCSRARTKAERKHTAGRCLGAVPDNGCAVPDEFRGWNIPADDAQSRIARAIRKCVGRELQGIFSPVLKEPIPPKLADLLRKLPER